MKSMGFAVVDATDTLLTVWLTSASDAPMWVQHSNAVQKPFAEHDPQSMLLHRHVIVTDRSQYHPRIVALGITECDPRRLAEEIREVQDNLSTEFQQHCRASKSDLVPPNFSHPPEPLDQGEYNDAAPEQLVLAVANHVRELWKTWILTDVERSKRPFLTPKGASVRLMPPRFDADAPVYDRR